MRIKICGITQEQDAMLSCEQGVWALGFNFYPKSARYITPLAAKGIIDRLPASVVKVGLFIGESYAQLASMQEALGLDFLQVYAPVPEAPQDFKKRLILSFQGAPTKADNLDDYAYLLLDAPKTSDGLLGGTGRLADWTIAASLAKHHRLILAGGIHADNVRAAFLQVQPYALDLASGVESSPGIKDPIQIRSLFQESTYDR